MRHDRAARVVGLIIPFFLSVQSWYLVALHAQPGWATSRGFDMTLNFFFSARLSYACGVLGVTKGGASAGRRWDAFMDCFFTFRHGYSAEACSSGVLLFIYFFATFIIRPGSPFIVRSCASPRDNTIPTLYMFILPALPDC